MIWGHNNPLTIEETSTCYVVYDEKRGGFLTYYLDEVEHVTCESNAQRAKPDGTLSG